jgi:hypothetical protein
MSVAQQIASLLELLLQLHVSCELDLEALCGEWLETTGRHGS